MVEGENRNRSGPGQIGIPRLGPGSAGGVGRLSRPRPRLLARQNQRLSGEDQGRFDSYFSAGMFIGAPTTATTRTASRMRMAAEVYDHANGIPHDVPFERVASRGGRH